MQWKKALHFVPLGRTVEISAVRRPLVRQCQSSKPWPDRPILDAQISRNPAIGGKQQGGHDPRDYSCIWQPSIDRSRNNAVLVGTSR
jgi:hypothetical protein